MRLLPALAAVTVAAALTSCAANRGVAEEDSFASQADSSFAPTAVDDTEQVTYAVPDSDCRRGGRVWR